MFSSLNVENTYKSIPETLEKISFKNSFYLIGQGNPNLRYLDPGQINDLSKVFCKENADIIYTRHLYYTNFTRAGCDVEYFNIVGVN